MQCLSTEEGGQDSDYVYHSDPCHLLTHLHNREAEIRLGSAVITSILVTISHFNHPRQYMTSHTCALIGASRKYELCECEFAEVSTR